ncbi:MAG: hypothetical protein COA86_11960 [Kangiella sp.]|nr:MAG: hypothetical protein COA86_11960 [Kangiella sp.]
MILSTEYILTRVDLISLFQQSNQLLIRKLGAVLFSLVLMACEQNQELSTKDNQLGFSKQSDKSNTQTASQTASQTTSPYGFDSEFNYPSFSGKYPVATIEMTVTDNSRIELFANKTINQNATPRRFNIRFYYPSAESDLDNETVTVYLNKKNTNKLPVISETAWSNLIGPQTRKGKMLRYSNYENAFWDIELNQKVSDRQTDFPLLIFSHGYGYSPEAYSALSAELASQGYIVISINHTFGANPTNLFGDQNETQWAKKLPTENIGQYLPIWSDDQIFVIEELYRLNTEISSPFYGRLNLSQLGIFGHSYGGASAYLSASRDPRIKAIMDIDGTLFEARNFEIYQPFAFLLSKKHSPIINPVKFNNDAFLVKLTQFEHISFTDHILWWQWDFDDSQLEMKLELGNINALEAVEITSKLVQSFFDTYLLNQQNWHLLTQENSTSIKSVKIN